METAPRASDLINGVVIKEEKRVESKDDDDHNHSSNKIGHRQEDVSSSPKSSTDLGTRKQMPTATATRRSPVASSYKESSPTHKDQEDDQLESAKAEMGEVREENERLKTVLARIMKEYQSLQMHYFDIVQQDQQQSANRKINNTISTAPATSATHQEMEDPELISLCLGRSSSSSDPQHHQSMLKENNYDSNHDQKISSSIISKSKKQDHHQEDRGDQFKQELALGLDCKVDVVASNSVAGAGSNNVPISPENSFELEHKDQEDVGEQWPPSKMLKVTKSSNAGDDEVSQQTTMKKARVSVRARCDTPTMNDGCQWRKYGQKIAKGNPCPRAYYRCTVAPACPVRKQVQRCAEDMSILITTYEGTHNHPLPISATAMASTTSAAACMLMSGSTSSVRPGITPSSSSITSAADLHGLNFSLSDNNNSRQRQFYLPNTSISSSPSYPTITLDLTAPPSTSSSSSTSQFNRLFSSSNFPGNSRYPTPSFNFSSSESNSNILPISWANGYLSYGTHQPYNSKNQMGALNLGRQVPSQEHLYQPLLQRTTSPSQQTLSETIAAATKAITSDPSFRSALASAITSIVNGGVGGAHGNQAVVENIIQNMKLGDQQFPTTTYTPSTNANGCGSSYLNRSSSSATQQQGNFLFLPPSLQPFTSSNNASASPVDNRNNIN